MKFTETHKQSMVTTIVDCKTTCLALQQNRGIISGGDDVTDVCDRCGYKERCIELGLDLDCQDEDGCSNYDTFIEEDENDE